MEGVKRTSTDDKIDTEKKDDELKECGEPNAKIARREVDEAGGKEAATASAVSSDDSGTGDSFEHEVGITEYTGADVKGFWGILKDRYSDFLVNEVTLSGDVVHLTAITLPSDVPSSSPSSTTKTDGTSNSGTEESSTTKEKTIEEELAGYAGKEEASRFMKWYQAQQEKKDDEDKSADSVEPVFKFGPIADKANRSAIHALVKARMPGFCSGAEQGIVSIQRGQGDVRHSGWPKSRPSFLEFTLYKENMDTSYALELLARRTGLRPNNFSVAGNKDKRGVTCQRVTAFRLEAGKLVNAVQGRLTGLLVGDFRYVDRPLGLGELRGNRFTLAIRDINADEAIVAAAVENLRVNGFINYFGLQRFGTGTVRTHQIGIAMLQNDWKHAADLVMTPHSKASAEANRARELYANGDLQGCLNTLPRTMHIERELVRGLIRCGENAYRSAFEHIPRTTRMLYLHAYQSFVWNHVASARIRAHGLSLLVGDLVLAQTSSATDALSSTEDNKDSDSAKKLPEVHIVTEEDVSAHKYSIRDVLLPLPGADVKYPENDTKQLFTDVLTTTGVTLEQIARGRGVYALRGDYRSLLCVPQDVEWSIAHYTDPIETLLRTDADVVRSIPPRKDLDPAAENIRKALCISFTLQASAYATMCYRELLKQATSHDYQTRLQHERPHAEVQTTTEAKS